MIHIKNETKSNETGHAVSFCDKVISAEYHFQNIDHVVLSRLNGEYKNICPECKKIIINALNQKS